MNKCCFLSILVLGLSILIASSAEARFYRDPEEVFIVEYPDSWAAQESRFKDSFAVGSDHGDGVDRCSFRKDSNSLIKGKNPNELVSDLLNSNVMLKEMRKGIPSAGLVAQTKLMTASGQPTYFFTYNYNMNYEGTKIAMRGTQIQAFNIWTGHTISIGCSTSLGRFPSFSKDFLHIFESLVITPE